MSDDGKQYFHEWWSSSEKYRQTMEYKFILQLSIKEYVLYYIKLRL